jgi:hypothetical protein
MRNSEFSKKVISKMNKFCRASNYILFTNIESIQLRSLNGLIFSTTSFEVEDA